MSGVTAILGAESSGGWIGVLPFVLIGVVAFALFYWLASRLTSGVLDAAPPLEPALLVGVPDEVLTDLRIALTGLRGHVTSRDGENELVVARTYFPAWVFVVVVLCFPFGLIALMARKTDSSLILVTQDMDRTHVRFSGPFSSKARAALQSSMASRMAPRTVPRTGRRSGEKE